MFESVFRFLKTQGGVLNFIIQVEYAYCCLGDHLATINSECRVSKMHRQRTSAQSLN